MDFMQGIVQNLVILLKIEIIGLYEESRWLKGMLRKMKIRKVMGFERIPIEVRNCLGGMGIGWLTNFLNEISSAKKKPEEWKKSTLITTYKNTRFQKLYELS